jgi:hypothetical protein
LVLRHFGLILPENNPALTEGGMENPNKRPKTLVFYAKHIPNRVGAGMSFEVSL